MKKVTSLSLFGLFSILTASIFGQNTKQNASCFSAEKYQKVYAWVVEKKGSKAFLSYGGYEIYPETDRLRFDKKNYLTGGISKNKGAYSVFKGGNDYERAVRKIDKVFCDILKEIK